MNWTEIEGKWDQTKGKVREYWGKFTDDDLKVMKGKRDQLIGKLRERYGFEKERAEKEISLFLSSCDEKSCASSSDKDQKSGCCN